MGSISPDQSTEHMTLLTSSSSTSPRIPSVRDVYKKDDGDGGTRVLPRAPLPYAPELANTGAIMSIGKVCLQVAFVSTVILYILNERHMLPRPIGKVVSKALFWPTLPITVSKRLGKWMTEIDDVVVLGGAPFGFMKKPEELHEKYDVSI